MVGRAALAFVTGNRVTVRKMPVVGREGFAFDRLDGAIRTEGRDGEHVAVDYSLSGK